MVITISIPMGLRLQVGQVGVQGHGSSQSGRLSFRRKDWAKLIHKSNVDFSILDLGKHRS